ncbi:MAG: hypothetical protein QOD99_104 [Chthoniobacter sp.]|jgi:hypothetical protein|nr:hypothetical protein [Chthoniobacter sp.]
MTIPEIVEQLKACHYECEAGPLENNIAFRELEKIAQGSAASGVATASRPAEALISGKVHDSAGRTF